jgi:hypothetical protein
MDKYETPTTYALATYGAIEGILKMAVMDIQEQTTVAKVGLLVGAIGTVALINELRKG